ncbi:MAG: glutamate--cysteine ligase [Granulosicoccus sp.]
MANLATLADANVFSGRRIGLEKESLRLTEDGAIAQSNHPSALGSALGHPSITTDFSEALLEMVTPPCDSAREALDTLTGIHQFILPRLPSGEHLWNSSMPCILRGAESIRIGDYGSSHVGRMKAVYRRGLGLRYGKRMQAIAGIHFNFSMPANSWPLWQVLQQGASGRSAGPWSVSSSKVDPALISRGYFQMMQNLMRIGWVVPYLFGSSPAICQSFLELDTDSDLSTFNETTRYAPFGTSLRMGNIGYRYREDKPIDLSVCHKSLDNYICDILRHVTTEHPGYRAQGIVDAKGEYRQLNACRLQIENEYYSTVRPKQIAEKGELPILALKERGIRYLELRSVDLNMFNPAGLHLEQIAMLEMLMLFAWLGCHEPLSKEEMLVNTRNVKNVAHHGREPGLTLEGPDGDISLAVWGESIIRAMRPLAAWLDQSEDTPLYTVSLDRQQAKFRDPDETPSARVLAGVFKSGSFFDFAMEQSETRHEELLAMPIDPELQNRLLHEVEESISRQAQMEAESSGSFEDYLAMYFAQLDVCGDKAKAACCS